MKNIEEFIKDYRKNRDDEHLSALILALREIELFVPLYKEKIADYSEIDNKIKKDSDVSPVIVATTDYKFWFSSFTKEENMPKSFLESYRIEKFKLKDLTIECLSQKDIEGVAINHSLNIHLFLDRKLLGAVLMFL